MCKIQAKIELIGGKWKSNRKKKSRMKIIMRDFQWLYEQQIIYTEK